MNRKITNFIIILCAIIISWVIANTVDMTRMELGALVNHYFPILFGGVSIIIYMIVAFFSKSETSIRNLAYVLALSNIAFGLYIRFADI